MEENNIMNNNNNQESEDKNNKEKIRYGKVIGISLILSIVISNLIIIPFIIIEYNLPHEHTQGLPIHISAEVQAQNGQFTGYFGERVSASDVKVLVSLIRSNNITSQTAGETKTIAIKFTQGTGSGIIMTPSAVSRSVISGKTYYVGTENDETCIEDEDPTESDAKDTTSAYYTSRFLRIISIQENGKKSGE